MGVGARLAVITTVALLLAGCGSPVGEIIDEPPAPRQIFGERLWDSTHPGVAQVERAVLHGDAIVIGGENLQGSPLTVVDAATGMPRWRIDGPLPGGHGATLVGAYGGSLLVTGPPDDFVVYVPYHNTQLDEAGVVALSGTDGSVQWMTRVGRDGDDWGKFRLAAADENLLLVGVADGFELRTVALETSDGSRRWDYHGMAANLLVGETAIGHLPREQLDGELGPPSKRLLEGTVVALDVATGQRRWDLAERFTDSVAELAAGGIVVVRATSRTEDEWPFDQRLLVEATTGREVASLGDRASRCASDAQSLIACVHYDNGILLRDTLVTFKVDERRIRESHRQVANRYGVVGVWHDKVFVGNAWERHQPWGPAAFGQLVDRSANVLIDRLPGQVVAISDRYAIFRTSMHGDIAVYAVVGT